MLSFVLEIDSKVFGDDHMVFVRPMLLTHGGTSLTRSTWLVTIGVYIYIFLAYRMSYIRFSRVLGRCSLTFNSGSTRGGGGRQQHTTES